MTIGAIMDALRRLFRRPAPPQTRIDGISTDTSTGADDARELHQRQYDVDRRLRILEFQASEAVQTARAARGERRHHQDHYHHDGRRFDDPH